MKLPILTEAQILGVKHPIVKGIARLCVTKNPTASLVAIIHCHRDMLSAHVCITSLYHDSLTHISDKDGACVVVCGKKMNRNMDDKTDMKIARLTKGAI